MGTDGLGGEPGESTVTRGGERGGESGPMEIGRSLGVPDRDPLPSACPLVGWRCA